MRTYLHLQPWLRPDLCLYLPKLTLWQLETLFIFDTCRCHYTSVASCFLQFLLLLQYPSSPHVLYISGLHFIIVLLVEISCSYSGSPNEPQSPDEPGLPNKSRKWLQNCSSNLEIPLVKEHFAGSGGGTTFASGSLLRTLRVYKDRSSEVWDSWQDLSYEDVVVCFECFWSLLPLQYCSNPPAYQSWDMFCQLSSV